MSRIEEATNKPQSIGRGRGRGRGRTNKHGGTRSKQHWDLSTDFDGEGSGFQRPRNKRKRRSTGGTVSHVSLESTQPPACYESGRNNYEGLSVDDKLSLILTKLATNETRMGTLDKKIDKAFGKGGQLAKLEETVQTQSNRLSALEYRSIDIEARSRRNNLLFKGFPENQNENCATTVLNFLKSSLEIVVDNVLVQRAHRLGRYEDGRTRFIIVAFTNYPDTENILSNAYKLKGSKHAISRDFPVEIVNARKQLWPQYRKLRTDYPQDKVYIAYPATLKHNGHVVRDMFPDWADSMRRNRACPSSNSDRHASRSRDQQTCRKAKHLSVYEETTDASPVSSESECDAQMVTSSDSEQSKQSSNVSKVSKEAADTKTVSSIPFAETSSQVETQPNFSKHSEHAEPESPSVIRDRLTRQHDPEPPPVFSVSDANA